MPTQLYHRSLLPLAAVAAGLVLILGSLWLSKDNGRRASDASNGTKIGDASNDETFMKSQQQWRDQLTEEQFYVTRRGGTERPFENEYWDCHQTGIYGCVCCGQPLFHSDTKFESGTGWPSFWQPIDNDHVSEVSDRRLWMVRTEVKCGRCDAHLGHVFDDGPAPTQLRYCLNSAALLLTAEGEKQALPEEE